MAFSAIPISKESNHAGDKQIVVGKYSSDGASKGGDIDTTLRVCENMILTRKGSSTAVTGNAVAESFPVAGNAVTIVTNLDEDGLWEAQGF